MRMLESAYELVQDLSSLSTKRPLMMHLLTDLKKSILFLSRNFKEDDEFRTRIFIANMFIILISC